MRLKFILFAHLVAFSGPLSAQPASIKWSKMELLLHPVDDTLYVINFWATWCKPCIEELPAFARAEEELKNEKVKFIYVSMDFKREFATRFVPFSEQHLNGKTVYLLDEPDYNSWISMVNVDWQGEIPATFIVRNHPSVSSFHSTQLSYSEINNLINSYLKK